eukprot:5269756-Alexandrium_andersonii.AAC.1
MCIRDRLLLGWPADSAELYATWLGQRSVLTSGLSGLRAPSSGLTKRPQRAHCLQGSAVKRAQHALLNGLSP